jgi:hypothetical protein
MTETTLTGIIYAINAAVLFTLVLSYWLMLRIEYKRHIFALFLFLISVFIFVVIGNVHIWSNWMMGSAFKVPYSWARGLIMLAASVFLLKTTWQNNIPK